MPYSGPNRIGSMRLGIIAAAAASATSEPVLGERDAQLVRERLEMPDLRVGGVHVLDAGRDMAEQLHALLDEHPEAQEALLYVSARIAVADGDCFLCVDLD